MELMRVALGSRYLLTDEYQVEGDVHFEGALLIDLQEAEAYTAEAVPDWLLADLLCRGLAGEIGAEAMEAVEAWGEPLWGIVMSP